MTNLTLLTVDDERHVHDGLDAIMDWEALGYTHVGAVHNGHEAIEIIRSTMPDVILTDIKMPGMSGIELITQIRAIPDYHPSIIVLSGYDEFEFARASLRFQVTDYLLKPIDEDELAMRLSEIRASVGRETPTKELAKAQRNAAASTVLRRLATTMPDAELLASARDLLGEVATAPCAFALVVPFGGPLSPGSVRRAIGSTKVKRTSDWAFQEAGGAVGALVCEPALELSDRAIDLWLKGLYRSLEHSLGIPAKLVLGRPVDDLARLKHSRDSVIDHMKNTHVMNTPGYLVVPPNEPSLGSDRVESPVPVLVAAVEEDSPGDIDRCLTTTFEHLTADGIPSTTLTDWLLELVRRIGSLISAYRGEPPASEDGLRAIAGRAELVPLSTIRESLSGYLHAAVEQMRQLRATVRHADIVQVRRLVDRRFAEDLTLTDVAQEVGMNPVYLGQVFRDVVGVGFKEYQRRCRIHEACRMLKETDMKVADIGATVGYATYDYFVEQFRREVDMTPSRFRRQ